MKERWDSAWEIVGYLITQFENLRRRISEKDDMNQTLLILKMTPTIIQITQEIRKQLEFIRAEQEQIKIQQNNFIYSPIQINQQINNILKTWVDQGYISILKKIPSVDIGEKDSKK